MGETPQGAVTTRRGPLRDGRDKLTLYPLEGDSLALRAGTRLMLVEVKTNSGFVLVVFLSDKV